MDIITKYIDAPVEARIQALNQVLKDNFDLEVIYDDNGWHLVNCLNYHKTPWAALEQGFSFAVSMMSGIKAFKYGNNPWVENTMTKKKIEVTGTSARLIDTEKVAKALGAEPFDPKGTIFDVGGSRDTIRLNTILS